MQYAATGALPPWFAGWRHRGRRRRALGDAGAEIAFRPARHSGARSLSLFMTNFISPLQITGPSTYAGIGFGVPAADPAILALRADLDARLHAVLAPLPAPMRAEADAI